MKSLTEPSIFWNSFFTVSLRSERGAVTDRAILDTVFVCLLFLHPPPLCVLSTPVLIVCSALISSTSVSLTSPSFCILPSSFVSLSSYLLGSLLWPLFPALFLHRFFQLACFMGLWFFALLPFSILFAFSDWFLLWPLPTPPHLLQTIVFFVFNKNWTEPALQIVSGSLSSPCFTVTEIWQNSLSIISIS